MNRYHCRLQSGLGRYGSQGPSPCENILHCLQWCFADSFRLRTAKHSQAQD
jgi:hypothetical protein